MANLFNHSYPYLDEHELNLDWLIAKMKELRIQFDEFKVVNNITFSGQWDITKQYPAWTIVSDNNIGYVSLQPVPVGVPLTNGNYWVEVIDYTAQIAGLESRVIALENEVDILDKKNEYVTPEEFGAAGDGVTDDTQAFIDALATGKVVLAFNNYMTSSTITIRGDSSGGQILKIYGNITYTGTGACIAIRGIYNYLFVESITGDTTNDGIHIVQDDVNQNRITAYNFIKFNRIFNCVDGLKMEVNNVCGLQYNDIHFSYIRYCTNAIHFILDTGWINSNYFTGGCIADSTKAVTVTRTTGEIDGNSFNNIGVEGITGRVFELDHATANNFTNIRLEAFSGDYLIYLTESSNNNFEGDMGLVVSQIYDDSTFATVLLPMYKNHYKAKMITNVPNGTWLDVEMYSFKNTFLLINNNRSLVIRADQGDIDLTAAGTILQKKMRILLGGSHTIKMPYFFNYDMEAEVNYLSAYTMTDSEGNAITVDFTVGGNGNKLFKTISNQYVTIALATNQDI